MTNSLRRIDILDAILDAGQASSDHTWRRLLKERPKTIPLRETMSFANVPTVIATRSSVGAIGQQVRSLHALRQDTPIVQPYVLDSLDEKLLSLLSFEEPMSVPDLTALAKKPESTVRNRLEKLSTKHLVRGIRGRGYILLTGAGK